MNNWLVRILAELTIFGYHKEVLKYHFAHTKCEMEASNISTKIQYICYVHYEATKDLCLIS